jgi:ABC-2 type transport system permease protein
MRRRQQHARASRQRLTDLATAEFVKAWTHPHLRIVAAAAIVQGPLLALTVSATTPAESALESIRIGQVAFIVFGVLAAGTEHHGGQIATTLTAVPRRLHLVGAKIIVCLTTVCALAITTVTVIVTVTAARTTGEQGPLTPHLLAHEVGAVIYLALMSIIGFAAATLTRDVIAASTATLTFVAVASIIQQSTRVALYLPSNAGTTMYLDPTTPSDQPGALGSATIVAAWTAAALTLAACAFTRRDT